jgi:hypothetical protein
MAKDLTEALRQLTEGGSGQTSRIDKTLPAARVAPTIPARTGSSPPLATKSNAGSIASPLVETAYSGRNYWASKTITSTDGLITWQVEPIKKMFFTDANSNTVEIDYAEPT